jgi:alkylhydroperoxidase family enzyme
MTSIPTSGSLPLAAVFGLRPEASRRFAEMYEQLWSGEHVDAVTVELIRLRVGRLLGCEAEVNIRTRAAVDAGLDEPLVAALGRWTSDPGFDDARRAALRFAEQYVIDPHQLVDDDFDRLAQHWTQAAVATIVLATAMCDALTRFRVALGVAPVGPEPTIVDGVLA